MIEAFQRSRIGWHLTCYKTRLRQHLNLTTRTSCSSAFFLQDRVLVANVARGKFRTMVSVARGIFRTMVSVARGIFSTIICGARDIFWTIVSVAGCNFYAYTSDSTTLLNQHKFGRCRKVDPPVAWFKTSGVGLSEVWYMKCTSSFKFYSQYIRPPA